MPMAVPMDVLEAENRGTEEERLVLLSRQFRAGATVPGPLVATVPPARACSFWHERPK